MNKSDEGIEHLAEIIPLYQSLGYEFVLVSAIQSQGIEHLRTISQGKLWDYGVLVAWAKYVTQCLRTSDSAGNG